MLLNARLLLTVFKALAKNVILDTNISRQDTAFAMQSLLRDTCTTQIVYNETFVTQSFPVDFALPDAKSRGFSSF